MSRIAHLTDVHLDGTADRRQRFVEALARAARAQPDHLVITGDLTAGGELAHLDEMAACLGAWNPRHVTVVPGNHDVGPLPWTEMLAATGLSRFAQTSRPGAVAVRGDVAIVAIDSQLRRRAPMFGALGKVSREQLRVVEDVIAHNGPYRIQLGPHRVGDGRVVVLAMHHGPQRSPLQPLDGLVNRKEVGALCVPGVTVLCGHDHRSLDLTLPAGGTVFVAPSVAESDDPLRTYEVSGRRVVPLLRGSAGQYMRGLLPF